MPVGSAEDQEAHAASYSSTYYESFNAPNDINIPNFSAVNISDLFSLRNANHQFNSITNQFASHNPAHQAQTYSETNGNAHKSTNNETQTYERTYERTYEQTHTETYSGTNIFAVIYTVIFTVIYTVIFTVIYTVIYADKGIQSSESYRFDYSHLDSNGTISMFNETDTFGTEYRVQMDGVSNYLDEGPTTEALVQSLNVYFSFWGAEDLEDYLEKSGLEKTEVVSISIDGENVSFVSNVREEETEKEQEQEQGKQDVQNIFDNIFTNDEGELSKRAVITIYSSVVAVAVAVALVVFRHRIGQRRLAQNGEAPSNDTHLGANCDGDDDEEKGGRKKIPTAASDKRSTDPKLGSDAKQTLHTSSSVEKASLNTSQDPAAKICETGSPPKPAAMNEANTSASDAKSDTNGSCLTSPVSPEKSQVSPDLANVASF
eukprot:jgi/Psemu1/69972/estExt_Genemark1.C_12260005